MSDLPRTGDVWWCEQYVGLHGNAPKDRYAVVIAPKDKLPDEEGLYLVVPVSASASAASRWVVPLPNRETDPSTSSGLPRACATSIDEYRRVPRAALTRLVGDLRTNTVRRLQDMVRDYVLANRGSGPGPGSGSGR